MNTKFLNTRYAMLHASYWAAYCVFGGYATVYLDGKGFSAGEIGILLAVANLLAALVQPIVAAKADTSEKISCKEWILLLGIAGGVFSALLCIPGMNILMIGFIFGIATLLNQVLLPLMNAISMHYLNQGENISYGLARGTGSLAYAGMSSLLGILIAQVGEISVPVTAVLMYIIFLALASSFKIQNTAIGNGSNKENGENRFFSLLKTYKHFTIFLIGIVLMSIFHFMTNTYMYQIVKSVGGNSTHMGIAISIAAMTEIPIMFLFSKIAKKVSVERLLQFSGVCWAIKAVTICFCNSVGSIYINQLLQMLAFGLYTPAAVYYANQVMDDKNKVKGQAMVTMAYTIGCVVGNFFGGKIIDSHGVHWLLLVGTGCTVLGMGLFFVGTGGKDS